MRSQPGSRTRRRDIIDRTPHTVTPHTIVVRGWLDIATGADLRHSAAARRGRPITLDLARVTFIDCAGLSALIAVRAEASATNEQVVFARPSQPVLFLLRATGTLGLLGEQESAPSACRSAPG